jgi:hypothetical protein
MENHPVTMTQQDVMRAYIRDELSKYGPYEQTKAYTDAVADDRVVELCRVLSKGRENDVFNKISTHQPWEISDVPVASIQVGLVNPTVNQLLLAHSRMLKAIAADANVTKHPEFAKQSEMPLESRRSFALKGPDGIFKLFDGIHRSIRLAADGAETIRLIYAPESAPAVIRTPVRHPRG